jgi:hypothetical protein
MDTENGVLELWSDGGSGVKEYRSRGILHPICDAGPELGFPTKTREADRCGKRRLGRRGFTVLSGDKVGTFTGFYQIARRRYRIFLHKSTQVVDFPRLAWLRVLWDESFREDAPKSPVFPFISGCLRLFPLILMGGEGPSEAWNQYEKGGVESAELIVK